MNLFPNWIFLFSKVALKRDKKSKDEHSEFVNSYSTTVTVVIQSFLHTSASCFWSCFLPGTQKLVHRHIRDTATIVKPQSVSFNTFTKNPNFVIYLQGDRVTHVRKSSYGRTDITPCGTFFIYPRAPYFLSESSLYPSPVEFLRRLT